MLIHQDEMNAALQSCLGAYINEVIDSIEFSHNRTLSDEEKGNVYSAVENLIKTFEWTNSKPMIDINDIDMSLFTEVNESTLNDFISSHGKNGHVPLLCHELGSAYIEFGSYDVIAFSEIICIGHERFFILKG